MPSKQQGLSHIYYCGLILGLNQAFINQNKKFAFKVRHYDSSLCVCVCVCVSFQCHIGKYKAVVSANNRIKEREKENETFIIINRIKRKCLDIYIF